MTIQELKYFVAVADHLHFSRAADDCHVTQPTLSAGIRSLEAKMGQKLFERGSHGVLLATQAEPLLSQARRILAEVRQLEQLARAGGTPLTGVLRLGAIPTIGPYLLPHIIPGIRRQWPDLKLHLVEGKTEELLAQLRRGDLDAALLSPPLATAGLHSAQLYQEEFLLATPAGHRLAAVKAARLADLTAEPLLLLDEGHCLRDQVVEFCRIGDSAARELLRSSSLETLRNMVAAGVGCTLLPALAVTPDHTQIEVRQLARPRPSRNVICCWRQNHVDQESIRLLTDSIRAHLPGTVTALT